jgi:hypothetical protein
VQDSGPESQDHRHAALTIAHDLAVTRRRSAACTWY